MSDLLPCPCCNNTDCILMVTKSICEGFSYEVDNAYSVYCQECGLLLEGQESAEEAITAWNTRTNPITHEVLEGMRRNCGGKRMEGVPAYHRVQGWNALIDELQEKLK